MCVPWSRTSEAQVRRLLSLGGPLSERSSGPLSDSKATQPALTFKIVYNQRCPESAIPSLCPLLAVVFPALHRYPLRLLPLSREIAITAHSPLCTRNHPTLKSTIKSLFSGHNLLLLACRLSFTWALVSRTS